MPTENVQFDLHRHPIKPEDIKEKELLSQKEKDAKGNQKGLGLSESGFHMAKRAAERLVNKVSKFKKAIVLGFHSNMARTDNSDVVFYEEMKSELAPGRKLEGGKYFDLNNPDLEKLDYEEKLKSIRNNINDTDNQIVIGGSPEDSSFGMQTWNMDAFKELTTKYGWDKLKDEDKKDEWMKAWLGNKDGVCEKISKDKNGKEAPLYPYTVAIGFKQFLKKRMKEVSEAFGDTDRPIIITGVGHSFEIDAAILAIMETSGGPREFGLDASSFSKIGGMIKEMENVEIELNPKTKKGTLTYRKKTIDINL